MSEERVTSGFEKAIHLPSGDHDGRLMLPYFDDASSFWSFPWAVIV